jgi:hypothetical protein
MTGSPGHRVDHGSRGGHTVPRAPLHARVAAGLIAVVLCGLAAPRAWATLGQPVESVAADQRFLRGEVRSTVGPDLRVDEITAPDGTSVREYVSPAGLVFAVAWSGPQTPDLARLLGSYFDEFQAATRSAVRRHHPIQVRSAHLVIESGGHVRALRGRVYLPHLMPESVSPAVLR